MRWEVGGFSLNEFFSSHYVGRSGHFAFVSTTSTDDGTEVQSEMEMQMVDGENHRVECLSFNFSMKSNGEVALLSIVQKDEAQESVGGEVRP